MAGVIYTDADGDPVTLFRDEPPASEYEQVALLARVLDLGWHVSEDESVLAAASAALRLATVALESAEPAWSRTNTGHFPYRFLRQTAEQLGGVVAGRVALLEQDKYAEARDELVSDATNDVLELLRQLATLRDDGILTDDEFMRKKTELLDRI